MANTNELAYEFNEGKKNFIIEYDKGYKDVPFTINIYKENTEDEILSEVGITKERLKSILKYYKIKEKGVNKWIDSR